MLLLCHLQDWCWLCERLIEADHYDFNNLLSGCSGQQFSEESTCCRFTVCRMLCGPTCSRYLKIIATTLFRLPFLLSFFILVLVFFPVSFLVLLGYVIKTCGDSSDLTTAVSYIFLGAPLYCPLLAMSIVAQVVYLPIAVVVYLLVALVTLMGNLCVPGCSLPSCFRSIDFLFIPLSSFAFIMYVMIEDHGDD